MKNDFPSKMKGANHRLLKKKMEVKPTKNCNMIGKNICICENS